MSMYDIILAKFALIMKKLAQVNASEQKVYNAGYEKGKAEGGYEQGVADGKQAEYDAFWDAYQLNGSRISYQYAFGNISWNDTTFKPKYDLVLGAGYSGTNMFANCTITDLTATLERQGVVLDTSQGGYLASMFQGAKCTRVPTLNLSQSHTYGNSLNMLFYNSTVQTIDKLIITEKTVFVNASFQGCANLENVTFEGVLGQNGLNLQWSTKLSKASIISVINALSTTTSGLSVTFSKTAKETAFTADEWAALIATKPNWTINLV